MPEGSFDACMADPPYGDTSLDWDNPVKGWIPAVARVLKPVASIWVFGSIRFLAKTFAEMEEHGFRYSQDIVWKKQNGTGFHADRFRRVHEHAVLFYRGAWGDVYHQPQYTRDAIARTVRRKSRPTHTGHIEAGHYVSEDGGPRLMTSVLEVRNEHGRAIHPTQKPLELLAPLIRYSVPPGGSFVVPFGGSGSDLVVARAEGLDAVACELVPGHAQRAAQRLAADAPLFAEV
ncbi:site-specific DNA-methyltransferase [Roseateles aquatilis]|uniref:Methyltransferase n=2 Tax=Roseateles aquatilis TaxID=431061 RepID=A0A246JI57_9BURK|nr:site-specific DNA-methyltransferase [Roseateles aquatilis]